MIVVNETGYLPDSEKIAVSDENGEFCIVDDNERKKLDTPIAVTDAGYDETAGHRVYRLDFSDLKDIGIYHIESDKGEASASFKVEPGVYKTLKNALQKFFYFQRCGMTLEERYAGPFKRDICHQGLSHIVGSEEKISIPKGWHDAGDYGRYVSAGAVAVAHLLYAYELFPGAFDDNINIPESGNGVPDILNECRYELEFLSSMQDEDGGVHHKATSWTFCGFVMPKDDDKEMFVFPVTSLSTADFAAVMCIASRVYEPYDPDFARSCMHQAYLAGQWLMEHPDNTDFHDPEGCNTGEYTDPCDSDERMWAYAELMRTDYDIRQDMDRSMRTAGSKRESRQEGYRQEFVSALTAYEDSHPRYDGRSVDDGFGWNDVSSFAAIAVIFDPDKRSGEELHDRMTAMLISRADEFAAMQEGGYPISMKKEDFIWGSNMVMSNRADILITAALVLRQSMGADDRAKAYEKAALNQIHYILGMNAMDISYVTGFGDNAFKDPHNRVTISDDIERPIPGELSGGPCILFADEKIKKHIKPGTPPQRCYLDHHLSYSSNEITIYWNSSLLFATAYFDRNTR